MGMQGAKIAARSRGKAASDLAGEGPGAVPAAPLAAGSSPAPPLARGSTQHLAVPADLSIGDSALQLPARAALKIEVSTKPREELRTHSGASGSE